MKPQPKVAAAGLGGATVAVLLVWVLRSWGWTLRPRCLLRWRPCCPFLGYLKARPGPDLSDEPFSEQDVDGWRYDVLLQAGRDPTPPVLHRVVCPGTSTCMWRAT